MSVLLKLPTTVKVLATGGPGSGKTTLTGTFPKLAYAGTEPNGIDTFRSNPDLAANLVMFEEFIPTFDEDIKQTFERLKAFCKRVKVAMGTGEVESFALDNASFLSENSWMLIDKHHRIVSAKSGEIDTRGMYGTLGRQLYELFMLYIISLPGNVIVTCHEMVEGEDAMKEKADKTVPIVPNILGGFREKVEGMFSASLFLECRAIGNGQFKYVARCRKGGQRNAKNRYNLPEFIENISYSTIVASIGKATTCKV